MEFNDLGFGGSTQGAYRADQARQRRYMTYLDQHGRKWGATTENRTGDPCGPIEPHFAAPLIPEQKYIVLAADKRSVRIDYTRWLLDLADAQAVYDRMVRETAVAMYGQKASEAIANPPRELLDRVGVPPTQRREPIEAAHQGNRWVLGLTPVKPAWANEFYPDGDPVHQRATVLEMTREYPDADDETGVEWAGPKKGWRLPNGEYVSRLDGEDKDAYKQRAEELARELTEV
jgi:hypothetical protein